MEPGERKEGGLVRFCTAGGHCRQTLDFDGQYDRAARVLKPNETIIALAVR